MKKVIIIGAGNIGKAAFEFVGHELVECFADNGKKGTEFLKRKVIPVEDLVLLKEKFVLLLAMIDYADELKQQLAQLGTEHYYYFAGNIYFFGGLRAWRQRTTYEKHSLWDYYRKYGLKDAVIIGAKSAYAEFFSEIFETRIISKDNFDAKVINAGKYLLNMEGSQNCDFVAEHEEIGEENIFVLPRLEDTGMKEMHGKLTRLKDIYKGKRCFIIGNGPSLKIEDLERLYINHEICFGLNVIHKLYAQTKWRPDYVCMADPLVIAQNDKAVMENNTCPKIVNDIKLFYQWETGEDEYLVHEINGKVGFSEDFVKGFHNGATVTYMVLQLCAYMGFEQIYLLGMDCSNWGSHFNKDYWQEGEAFREPDEAKTFMAYGKAEQYAREHDFRIFNATRGGKLEVFERVNFDDLFPSTDGV